MIGYIPSFLLFIAITGTFAFQAGFLSSKTFSLVKQFGKNLGKSSKSLTTNQQQLQMSALREKIDNLINENKVMVFSKTYCPYCTRAKEAIAAQGVSYKVVELDVVPDGAEIQAELQKKTGQRTVPNIFVNKNHVGGCDKTLEAINNGNFKKLLNA